MNKKNKKLVKKREKTAKAARRELMSHCVDDRYMIRPLPIDKGRQIFVQDPHLKTIATIEGANTRKYRLALPYFVFVRVDALFRVAISPHPVNSLDAAIYWAPFPNIGPKLTVCMDFPMKKDLEKYITRFWSSPFYNDSTIWVGPKVRKKVIGDYETWHNKSINNPNFVLMLDWVPITFYGQPATVEHMTGFSNDRSYDVPSFKENATAGLWDRLINFLVLGQW